MKSLVAQKLRSLTRLQAIDSQLDEIKKVRGALPEEVMDLEDEIAGYETRIENHQTGIDDMERDITHKKKAIKQANDLVAKYEEQQMNVRNNREYDAITKEIELQQLEAQILEKKIKEIRFNIEAKNDEIEETKQALEEKRKDLESKKNDLESITKESKGEEEELLDNREKAKKGVDKQLFNAYEKIRNNARNGLAVVSVKRGACGGCFNAVPPQKQAEIREQKKIIVCEYCGRIIADVEDVIEEPKKPTRTTRKKTTTATAKS